VQQTFLQFLADRKKMAQEERRGGPSEEEGPRMRDECREISFVAEFRHFVNLKKGLFCCKFHFLIKKLPKFEKLHKTFVVIWKDA
jgi:hypothetical protein